MQPGRLFADLPDPPFDEEHFATLAQAPGVLIERIVSTGQCTPEGAWLVQDRDEWVVLLQGSATLRLADEPDDTPMTPGDFIHLPANTRHRVECTDVSGPTVWLAVHYDAGPPARDQAHTDPTP